MKAFYGTFVTLLKAWWQFDDIINHFSSNVSLFDFPSGIIENKIFEIVII